VRIVGSVAASVCVVVGREDAGAEAVEAMAT